MKNTFYIILTIVACFLVLYTNTQENKSEIIIQTTPNPYIGKIEIDSIVIRLLVLKHCPDSIADTDGNQAIQAANLAASKGLTIKNIGNYHVDKQGMTEKLAWGKKYNDLEGLKKFISDQMKIDAKPNDTFIVYTIGHGGKNGSIMRLGQREGVMKIIAEAAEENEQETLWWQLSCHAAAKLPKISTLNARQQELFSMMASSSASKLSYFCTQGARMEKIFVAIAEKSSSIDSNSDEIITAGELKRFIADTIGKEYGDLVFAKSDDEVIFGWTGRLVNSIPIIDRNSEPNIYPRNYIPIP